jgi:hypothetical protein
MEIVQHPDKANEGQPVAKDYGELRPLSIDGLEKRTQWDNFVRFKPGPQNRIQESSDKVTVAVLVSANSASWRRKPVIFTRKPGDFTRAMVSVSAYSANRRHAGRN